LRVIGLINNAVQMAAGLFYYSRDLWGKRSLTASIVINRSLLINHGRVIYSTDNRPWLSWRGLSVRSQQRCIWPSNSCSGSCTWGLLGPDKPNPPHQHGYKLVWRPSLWLGMFQWQPILEALLSHWARFLPTSCVDFLSRLNPQGVNILGFALTLHSWFKWSNLDVFTGRQNCTVCYRQVYIFPLIAYSTCQPTLIRVVPKCKYKYGSPEHVHYMQHLAFSIEWFVFTDTQWQARVFASLHNGMLLRNSIFVTSVEGRGPRCSVMSVHFLRKMTPKKNDTKTPNKTINTTKTNREAKCYVP
jgi:hypothetical protein